MSQINELVTSLLNITNNTPSLADRAEVRKQTQIEEVRAVELGDYWIGTDESGKGDYFGPLVSSAVFVDHQLAAQLEQLGVTDSKRLTDKKVMELAPKIKQLCGTRWTRVIISPLKYNRLYRDFVREGKNLNTLLAWAHTRALENILKTNPLTGKVVVLVDKFADEHYIQNALLPVSRTAQIELVQLPKAEANIAVAAASIIARYHFLRGLTHLSTTYSTQFPKGASDPRIINIAKDIVGQRGKKELAKLAKVHFKTTKKVLA